MQGLTGVCFLFTMLHGTFADILRVIAWGIAEC